MKDILSEISNIVEEALSEDSSQFLVDVVLKGNVGNQKLIVLIDGDQGITIDACAKVSRAVGLTLEEINLIDGKYTLEVSSPGLDHPIKLPRQYTKNIERGLEVEFNSGEKVNGKLKKVSDDGIVIQTKKEEKTFSFSEINQSKIEVSFK